MYHHLKGRLACFLEFTRTTHVHIYIMYMIYVYIVYDI